MHAGVYLIQPGAMVIRMGSITGTSACLMIEERLNVVQRGVEKRDGCPLRICSLDLRSNLFGVVGSYEVFFGGWHTLLASIDALCRAR